MPDINEPPRKEFVESNNPHNKMRLVRDLGYKKVKLTYHHRDPGYASMLGKKPGDKGPFDWDEIVEGELVPACCYIPGRNFRWGIQLASGEIAMMIFSPMDPAVFDEALGVASQWDGKRNGTYEIEAI